MYFFFETQELNEIAATVANNITLLIRYLFFYKIKWKLLKNSFFKPKLLLKKVSKDLAILDKVTINDAVYFVII